MIEPSVLNTVSCIWLTAHNNYSQVWVGNEKIGNDHDICNYIMYGVLLVIKNSKHYFFKARTVKKRFRLRPLAGYRIKPFDL